MPNQECFFLSDYRLQIAVSFPWLTKLCVHVCVWFQAVPFHQERIHPLKQSCCGRIPIQTLLTLGPYLKQKIPGEYKSCKSASDFPLRCNSNQNKSQTYFLHPVRNEWQRNLERLSVMLLSVN